MAVSSVNNFTVTRDDIIKASLRALGVIGAGETPSTEDVTNCSQAMNIMLKSWSKKGIPLWVINEISFPLVTGTQEYYLGPTGGRLATDGIVINNGGTGGIDGTYALTITDATGTGATGTYTVAGGTVTAITITAAGTKYASPTFTFGGGSGVTGVDYTVYVIGKYMDRPLNIFDSYHRNNTSSIDTPLVQISRSDYILLGNKFNESVVNQYYFDNQIETAKVVVSNLPSDNNFTFRGQVQRQFYDMNSSTDNFDFPQAWFQALKWGLCAEILTEYNISKEMIPYYEQKSETYIAECFDESVEDPSVYFTLRSR